VADLQEVRDCGKARRIIKNLAIKRANGVYMRPTTAADITIAWSRIETYITKLKAKPAPVMEVASRIWQLSLCRTTPDPQQVAAELVNAGVVTVQAVSSSSKAKAKKLLLQYEGDFLNEFGEVQKSNVLQAIESSVPKTLYNELPRCRKAEAEEPASATDRGASASDRDGAIAYSWSTRTYTRRSFSRHSDYPEAEQVQDCERLGKIGGIKIGTGARAKGVVGKMPFNKQGHYARWSNWKEKKERHTRAHGGLKKKCPHYRNTIRC